MQFLHILMHFLSSLHNSDQFQIDRVLEENRRLMSLMEEKDRKIHLLEYKVEQLMSDTKNIAEEQSRLQKENSTLLKAISNLAAKEAGQK